MDATVLNEVLEATLGGFFRMFIRREASKVMLS